MMQRKPRISKGPASAYAAPGETILEFNNGTNATYSLKGGLISFRNKPDGTLQVSIYNTDPGVEIIHPDAPKHA